MLVQIRSELNQQSFFTTALKSIAGLRVMDTMKDRCTNWEDLRYVVSSIVDDNPQGISCIMLLNLLSIQHDIIVLLRGL